MAGTDEHACMLSSSKEVHFGHEVTPESIEWGSDPVATEGIAVESVRFEQNVNAVIRS